MDAVRTQYPERVPIHLAHGAAYLWERRDVERVRKQHRLCGLLSGTLPLIPQQNVFLGLPLRMLPEEVVFLLRTGNAVLIDDERAYDEPTPAERDAFLKLEADSIAQQRVRVRAQQEEHRQKMEDAVATDDAARGRRLARRQAADTKGEENTDPGVDASHAAPPYLHYTAGSSAHAPGFCPRTRAMTDDPSLVNAYTSLRDAAAARVWAYPQTVEERARCAVFEDLHSKGNFLSTGLRFGGDFVVYPGDPLRYHSHYTATVLATPDTPLHAFHVIAAGRLGTAVKKSHLLCQANTRVRDDTDATQRRADGGDDAPDANDVPVAPQLWGDVQYWSLAWAGFGT
ncbi:tRNA-intron lyase [Malassezia sp. CBS 17886]|nr:tRNA-intron lyase [Malassezia sp. CBS 17886]